MNLIYSYSEVSFHFKPADAEILKIKVSPCKTAIEKLIERIEQGKPFTCQVYSGKRNTNNFIAQTMFALDFDDTISLTEIEAICADFGLPYNLGYSTYSHTENNPRYRIIFTCDGEVRTPKMATDLNNAFEIIFNFRSDSNCKDLARLFLGTDKKVFRGHLEATFKPATIFNIANELKYIKAGNRGRKGFDIDLIEETGNNGNTIIYRYRKNDIPPICDESDKQQKLIDNWQLQDLFQCKLFKTFYDGGGTPLLGCKLNDSELLCMASNLMRLEGGDKLYKTCIEKNSNYAKEKKSKISYLRNQENYATCLIGKYSPYGEDQLNHYQTFPEFVRKKGKVEIIKDNLPRIVTLLEAGRTMIQEFDNAEADTSNAVYLFKLAAGLGKSEYWRNKKGIVIGFPNNNLKNEQFEDSKLTDTEKMVTPDALTKFSAPVQAYLNALYEKGLNEHAFFKIKDLANGHSIFDDGHIEYADFDLAAEYLRQNRVINDASTDMTVFTTHTRMVHQSFKHYTYVFDENAFSSIFEQHKTTLTELKAMELHLMMRGVDTNELKKILTITDDGVHTTPDFANYLEIVKEIIRSDRYFSNILKFFTSSTFTFDGEFIHYVVNHLHKLPKDKKLIFLDATASNTFFESVFGERLKVIDISNVEFQGKLVQDTSKSCSKTQLGKYCDKISAKVGGMPVITHIAFKKHFKNPVDELHFGNLKGSNILSGKDFCVVGTMTFHPTYFQFLADVLNIKCEDFKMKNLKVIYDGRSFWFTTFKNPQLQRLHLEQVEGELIQGVHRARLIRTDATVKLFSNFPLLQAKYIY